MRAPPLVDPRKCTIALDAGVLTRKGWVRTRLAGRFRTLRAAGAFRVVMVGGGSDEKKFTGGTAGAPPDLQEVLLEVLHELLQGRRLEDDCPRPFDQLDPRTSYFVTDDYRVLQNRNVFLEEEPSLIAVTLEEFFEIYQRWVNWNS
ncbi:hypothetical protein [Reyranella sp.]|jgi:hypothetical protein|uniref:hypothetical protein n=1 Tax=Reyranella sp. TaxID=1929291 RepID=UPI00378403E2